MKKLLLVVLTIGFVTTILAQNNILRSMDLPVQPKFEPAPKSNSNIEISDNPNTNREIITGSRVTYMPIGQSSNIVGFDGNPRTYLWADPRLNSVVFTHKGNDENSVLNFDVSTDGGASWSTNNMIDVPDIYAQYAQGGIINDEGNTNPDNAYYTCFSETTDGLSYGVNSYSANKRFN